MFDVHVFLATGAATAESAGCRIGDRHELLIFSRQPIGESPNRSLAVKGAKDAGWADVEIERSKRLPSGAAPGDAVLQEAFGEALAEGCAVVAHRRSLSRT
jgi:hypothetical protein